MISDKVPSKSARYYDFQLCQINCRKETLRPTPYSVRKDLKYVSYSMDMPERVNKKKVKLPRNCSLKYHTYSSK